MKIHPAVWSLLVISMWSAVVVHAQELRYLGPNSSRPTGWIELSRGQVREVAVGEEIPGWGRVVEIAEMHLAVEQPVSEAEQDRLRSQGMATYEVLELRIPRADLGALPLPSPR
ncbi:MAG: hypothetical protein ACREJ9_05770 [Candidatus Rokuibacteriota bacterium]